MEHDEKNEQDKSWHSKKDEEPDEQWSLHFSPKFGQKVIEMQMLLLSKQVAWKGEELNNLYDYVFKKYIECMAEVLTCPEDSESLEFLILMTEHAVQVVMDDLSFLRVMSGMARLLDRSRILCKGSSKSVKSESSWQACTAQKRIQDCHKWFRVHGAVLIRLFSFVVV